VSTQADTVLCVKSRAAALSRGLRNTGLRAGQPTQAVRDGSLGNRCTLKHLYPLSPHQVPHLHLLGAIFARSG